MEAVLENIMKRLETIEGKLNNNGATSHREISSRREPANQGNHREVGTRQGPSNTDYRGARVFTRNGRPHQQRGANRPGQRMSGPHERTGQQRTYAAVARGSQVGAPGPARTTDVQKNPTLESAAQGLFRTAQMQRHMKTWQTVPKQLEEEIDYVFQSIKPPMSYDEQLQNELTALREHLKTQLKSIVMKHLERQLITTRDKLKLIKLTAAEEQSASDDAWRIAGRRYGRKSNSAEFSAWMEAARTSLHHGNEDTQTIAPMEEGQVDSRKRVLTSPTQSPGNNTKTRKILPPTPTQQVTSPNRFEQPRSILTGVHDVTGMGVDGNDEEQTEPTEGLTHLTTPTNPSTTASAEKTPSPATTPSQPRVVPRRYTTSCKTKSDWTLQVRGSPKTIVISDTSMEKGRNIPEDWELHVFPGAYLRDASNVLHTAELPESIENIVLVVGANNVSWDFEKSTEHDMKRLMNQKKLPGKRLHFVGIPTPARSQHVDNIRKMNECAQLLLGFDNFIQPATQNQVGTITMFDPHYIPDKIMENIKNHLPKN